MTSNKRIMRRVLLAQAGDPEALNALFKVIQDPLFRYIIALVGERSLAEDILQEVFLQIFRKLAWLREPELLRPLGLQDRHSRGFSLVKEETPMGATGQRRRRFKGNTGAREVCRRVGGKNAHNC